MKHIAMIPARLGSQRFKFKNRKFFNYTSEFLDQVDWFSKSIVSTDDPVIEKYAKERNYDIHKRPEHLTGPAVSIKDVFISVIQDMNIEKNDILWLFYLPLTYKNIDDFNECKGIIENDEINSICTFIPVKSHPYNCWKYNSKEKLLSQYIKNDVFRTQDLPEAWEHYHYVCCFKCKEIENLNNELINSKTYPFFLEKSIVDKLIEIDTPEDYEKWKIMKKRGVL